ncbi:hypothetical protein ScPMuIL_018898 [Solemya velum]
MAMGDGAGTEVEKEMIQVEGDSVPSMKKTPSTSRFQVDRVDSEKSDNSGTKNRSNHVVVSLPSEHSTDSLSATSLGTDSQPASPTLGHDPDHHYETHVKTFGRNTTEALPHVDHYRNLLSATCALNLKSRPTLAELHEVKDESEAKPKTLEPLLTADDKTPDDGSKKETAVKFGWIKGVLIRCLLNIWGVMLFLRLSWFVGQAGIGLTCVIILLSAVVTTLTSISMTAICNNGMVKGGGAYFMISRSLGPEFGGAIGLIFSMANAVAVAMYVVGFAETVRDLLKEHDSLMIDEVNDIRVIGVITITILLCIAIVGMEWEARAQLILLVVLIIAVINFVIGTLIPPTEQKYVQGFVGYKGEVFKENFPPDFREGEGFFSVFAIFFPAATGILAGANISGDLKNAQKDIPLGTFLAILISSIVYLCIAVLLGGCLLRESTGFIIPVGQALSTTTSVNGLINATLIPQSSMAFQYTFDTVRNCSLASGGQCTHGLLHDYQIMEMVSGFGPLITAGIFSATLSSALASLVSAPKIFQAVCKDKIFPKIHIFAKGDGPGDNPRRAYLLAYFIGFGFICIGDLNAIAPIISNFFLMSYALINYSCFDASLARSPGWRPSFRYYSMWVSLVGAMVCITVMFIINWWTALITFAVVAALFIYVHYTKPDINWGSSIQAHFYRNALQATLKLVSVEEHVKNFRPQILVLTGLPSHRPALVDFVNSFTKKTSLMISGHIIVGKQSDNVKDLNKYRSGIVNSWFHHRRVKSFYSVATAKSFRRGVQALTQNTGVGKLKPNILIMGFKANWKTSNPKEVEDYFYVIHDCFDIQYGVGIFRMKEGLDCGMDINETIRSEKYQEFGDDVETSPLGTPCRRGSNQDGDLNTTVEAPAPALADENYINPKLDNINLEAVKSYSLFHKKPKKAIIDVWWLFDDGGLTLLIPYLLTTNWSDCQLRVFAAGTKRGELDREQRQMATLLSKFRIECKNMTVIPDMGKSPKEENMQDFDNLISDWVLDEANGETQDKYPWKVTEDDKLLLRDKTKRNVRIRELLIEHSSDATLIVMTLPIPRKGTCPAGLYMAWIDTLTRDMPPILLLRGNQTSVLTFYS